MIKKTEVKTNILKSVIFTSLLVLLLSVYLQTCYAADKTYIYKTENGFVTAEKEESDAGDRVKIKFFNNDLELTEEKSIMTDLPIFGGYYFDGIYHYIISGQKNEGTKSNTDIYAVSKYNKSLKTKILKNTLVGKTLPLTDVFLTGGADLAMKGNTITFSDTALRKRSIANEHTQVNVKVSFDMKYLSFTDAEINSSIRNIDGEVYEDYPVLTAYVDNNDTAICAVSNTGFKSIFVSGAEFGNSEKEKTAIIFEINSDDEKNLGATLDGFEVSDTKFVAAGTAVNPENKIQNIFVSTLPKTQLLDNLARTQQITNYPDDSSVAIDNVKLIMLDSNNLALLWNEKENNKTMVYGVFLDANGNKVSDIKPASQKLTDCQPIYDADNDTIYWYANNKISSVRLNSDS